jgi:hypothetical protein
MGAFDVDRVDSNTNTHDHRHRLFAMTTSWSLKRGIKHLSGHLPAGYAPSQGVRKLFPQGYAGSISPLKGYIFAMFARVATHYDFGPSDNYYGSAANAYVMADGLGNWFFSWLWWPVALNQGYSRHAGFTFRLSDGGDAHVWVDTTTPNSETLSCASGVDPWIANNWPAVFKAGANVTLIDQTTSDFSAVWTSAGFAAGADINLHGGATPAANTSTGTAFFPFPNTNAVLVSPGAAAIGPLLSVAGLLAHGSTVKLRSSFSSKGLNWTLTAPSSGDSGDVVLGFKSADGTSSGTYTWKLPNFEATATGQATFDISGGSCALNYSISRTGSETSLDYTATASLANNVVQTTTAKVVNGSVISQRVNTSASGNNTLTELTSTPNGGGAINGSQATAGELASLASMAPSQQDVSEQVTAPLANVLSGVSNLSIPSSSDWTAAGWSQTSSGWRQTVVVDTPSGPATATVSVTTGPGGAITGYSVQENGATSSGGSSNFSENLSVDFTAGLLLDFFGGYELPVGDTTYGSTMSYHVGSDGMILSTNTASVTNQDGSSSSYSVSANAGTVTGQTVTVTDTAGNNSTSSVNFTSGGGFQITITTTDNSGNGTTETITGDASGNLVSDTVTPTGGGGAGTVQPGGGVGGGDLDGDDDDSEDGSEDGDD